MKTVLFTVRNAEGESFKWSFQYLKHVYSTLGRHMNGWLLTTHDGCERFSEGGWIDFVPFVHLVAGNYGCTAHLS